MPLVFDTSLEPAKSRRTKQPNVSMKLDPLHVGGRSTSAVANLSPVLDNQDGKTVAQPSSEIISPKSEPSLKWELPNRSLPQSATPLSSSDAISTIEQPSSTGSIANHSGALTVHFGQPKRWVLPPVTVHQGDRTNSEGPTKCRFRRLRRLQSPSPLQ